MSIPLFRPSLGTEEYKAVREALESGWIGLGPKTHEFEDRFSDYVGTRHAIATNSATAALHLAMLATNVGPGDEVITTPMTFVSTNHVILYCRATPVFADIEEDTLNIRVDEIERLLTPRTKVILIVHYGGHPCDIDPIMELAKDRGIVVIDDAAHACGARYKGRRIGSLTDLTCFSFHAIKNLSTGEGGMITTTNDAWDKRLRKLRWMGINKDTWTRVEAEGRYSWYYWVDELGYKYHMNDLAAAIGLVQLRRLEATNAKRREIVETYNAAFADLDWLETPVEKDYASSAHHNYVVKLDHRDDLIAHLGRLGIGTGVHYIPSHYYDMYASFRRDLPVTERVWKRIVTLPLFPDLLDEQILRVIEGVRSFGRQL